MLAVAAAGDLGAIAVVVAVLRPVGGTDRDVIAVGRPHCPEQRAHRAAAIGAEQGVGQRAPALAGPQDVVGVLGGERHHAADGAGAVDVGDRAAHHLRLGEHLRIEIELAVGAVAGALEVLAGAVDDHRDAAEILQAANIDRRTRVVAAVGERHAGDVLEHLGRPSRHDGVEVALGHHADRRQRVDRPLLRPRRQNRYRVEHQHLVGAQLLLGRRLLRARRLRHCHSDGTDRRNRHPCQPHRRVPCPFRHRSPAPAPESFGLLLAGAPEGGWLAGPSQEAGGTQLLHLVVNCIRSSQ